MSAGTQAKAVVLVLLIGIIGCLGLGLLPVRAAGGLKCEAPLRGGEPSERATVGYLVNREDAACDAKAGSRLTILVIGTVLYLAIGVASVTLPESNFERVAFGGEDPEDVYERN